MENDQLRREFGMVEKRGEDEINRMRRYIEECEQTIEGQRERLKDIEKQVASKSEQHKLFELNQDKLCKENSDLK